MNSVFIALVSAGSIFSGALIGLGLQRLLPGHHLNKETQDIVKLSAGTIATLTALVLGLLVSSAKSSFDAMNNGILQSSAKIILLDSDLARYGPETKAAREQLKRTIAGLIEMVWPTERTEASALTAIERANGIELVRDRVNELTPKTDAQRQALAAAQQTVGELRQTRWLLIEQEQNPLPLTLLVILVFWLSLLFVSFGLFAPFNGTTLTVLLIGACAISAAIFLILEMDRPLEGIMKVSDVPLRNALRQINQ